MPFWRARLPIKRRDHHHRQQLYRTFAQRDALRGDTARRNLPEKSESMVGPLTRQYVQQVHFSKAFIGIDGWQPETGFTGRDMMRSDVVNAVLEKECEAIVLTDSSKFGAVHPYTMGPVSRFSRVITDERLSDAHRNKLEDSGLIVNIIKTSA